MCYELDTEKSQKSDEISEIAEQIQWKEWKEIRKYRVVNETFMIRLFLFCCNV